MKTALLKHNGTVTSLLFVLALAILSQSALAGDVKVSISGGFDEIASFEHDHVTYISLSEFARIIGGNLDWSVIGHTVTYEVQQSRFELLIGAPYFYLDDSLYNLTYPVRFEEGQLYVPALTFLPFLDRTMTQKITWDEGRETVRVDSDYFNVTDLAVSSRANGLLIEVFLTGELPYDVFVTEGNWVNISIPNARINTTRIMSRSNPRYMYRLKCHQVEGTGQISIRLKRPAENWHHKLVFDPPRIQVAIADADFELGEADTAPLIGPDEKIDVVVIDPGHGGRDYGAIGGKGTREKDVVLKIGKELARMIRADRQFKVVMTRDRDETVSLEKRAAIANNAGADLFISIHANASPKQHVRGWNVFFLAPARNDSARSVEQLENSYFLREIASTESGFEDPEIGEYYDPIKGILSEMIMTEFQEESHDLAMMVDKEFRRCLKTPARGVDQAGFFVLNKVFTPSVLVESAFISNRTEEKLLRDDDYRKQVAEGIYSAIKRFKAKYEAR